MKIVKLDASKLLGFRIQNAGAKVGTKTITKLGAKLGTKLGIKT